MTPISPDVLEKLRQYDTPTISNITELFELRPRNTGYMGSSIRAAFPDFPPMVGFASTITCRTHTEPGGGDVYGSLSQQVERYGELSGPPVIVFQDLDGPQATATFGEIMCTTYKTFGAVGLVTSGPGRDIDQVRAIEFPVFTNGYHAAHGYIHLLDIHVAVSVGGLTVYPNDLLHGDLNGVVTIPHEIAVDVASIADEFIATEQIVLDALKETGITPARLREAQAESKQRATELRRRVSRKAAD